MLIVFNVCVHQNLDAYTRHSKRSIPKKINICSIFGDLRATCLMIIIILERKMNDIIFLRKSSVLLIFQNLDATLSSRSMSNE